MLLVDNLGCVDYLGCFLLIIWGARTDENPTDYLSHSLVEDSAGGRPMLMILMSRTGGRPMLMAAMSRTGGEPMFMMVMIRTGVNSSVLLT